MLGYIRPALLRKCAVSANLLKGQAAQHSHSWLGAEWGVTIPRLGSAVRDGFVREQPTYLRCAVRVLRTVRLPANTFQLRLPSELLLLPVTQETPRWWYMEDSNKH